MMERSMLLMSSGTEANSSYMSNVKCGVWKIIFIQPNSINFAYDLTISASI